MNIDEMPAGEEMDALIDHEIFGRKWKNVPTICLNGIVYHGNHWIPEADDPMNPPPGYTAIPSGPPPHSTDDTLALELVKHMRSLRYSYTISSIGRQVGVTCSFWGGPSGTHYPNDGYHARAFTLSLAACRAALKAATTKEQHTP